MRPHIICHMASSIDGKIDGGALRNVMREGDYEELHAKLEGDAWICGRTTMQQHFAEAEPFVSSTNTDYLAMLREKQISYLVAGQPEVDLAATKYSVTDNRIHRFFKRSNDAETQTWKKQS